MSYGSSPTRSSPLSVRSQGRRASISSSPLASASSSKASSPSASPPSVTYRLPRVRSRPRLTPRASLESIVEEAQGDQAYYNSTHPSSSTLHRSPSSPALDRIKGQWDASEAKPVSSGTDARRRSWKPQNWNGKSGISMGKGMKDVCGICFESAVKPNKTRCCGQLFCFQHLSDWLSANSSDGRCPTCRVHLSLETDTIFLHPPTKVTLSPLSTPRTTKRRTTTSAPRSRWPGLVISPPRRHSFSSSSSSGMSADSSEGSSSSESEAVESRRRRRASQLALIPRPQYESMSDLMSSLMPIRDFGSLLSLLGCALVVGTLLS